MSSRRFSFPFLLLLLGTASLCILGSGVALWAWPGDVQAYRPTAILTILPYSPAAPTPVSPLSTSTLTPTPIPPFVSDTEGIRVGVFVQIRGTGGDGLRLRVAPGLNAPVRFLAREAEVFQVVDGPQQADGYIWWHLRAPYDKNRAGWAVANYLSPLPDTPAP